MAERRSSALSRFRLLPDDIDTGWMPYAWLAYLIPVPVEAYFRHFTPLAWAALGAGLLAFLPLYFRSYWARGRAQIVVVAGMTLLGVAASPFLGSGIVFFVFASCCVPAIGRPNVAYRNVAIYTVAIAVVLLAQRADIFELTYALMLSGLLGAVSARGVERDCANAALRLAHDEVQKLATVAERERIARDLHDVLGHTLSVIVLKSELAAKLAEVDVARAAQEIREVEQIAREALGDVREAIAGYRSAGMDAEFARARSVLEVAGVTVACESEPVPLTPTQEGVLALAMREGVTNIIRHARATSCRLRLGVAAGKVRLEIADDGRGGSPPEGSGLAGMRERVEALGGTLSREAANGTRLIVTLPA